MIIYTQESIERFLASGRVIGNIRFMRKRIKYQTFCGESGKLIKTGSYAYMIVNDKGEQFVAQYFYSEEAVKKAIAYIQLIAVVFRKKHGAIKPNKRNRSNPFLIICKRKIQILRRKLH